MREKLTALLATYCSGCLDRLRAFSGRALTATLLHAWVLGFLAVCYVAWSAPLALESLVLVAAKVWFGALIGFRTDSAVFSYAQPSAEAPNGAWMARQAGVIAACVLGLALGV